MRMLLALLCLPLAAEQYTFSRASTKSGAAEVVTVQLPSTAAPKQVFFLSASVYCSVTCDITLERDGTAATGTAGTIVRLNRYSPASAATAYHTSDVGTGTTLSIHTLQPGTTLIFNLADKGLYQTNDNLTFRTSSITGDVKINVQWDER